jgi:uncharacterized protein
VTFLYLDASAWVKRFYLERGSERLKDLLSQGDVLACSVLGVVEVIAALARKRRAGEIAGEACQAKLAEVEQDWGRFLQLGLGPGVLDLAKEAAGSGALRGADAIHFASLEMLRRRVSAEGHRVVLVASGLELLAAASSAGVDVMNPEVIAAE